jgi:hypothetical protein
MSKNYEEVIDYMKSKKMTYLGIVEKVSDSSLGVFAHLTPAGKLVDGFSKAIPRKKVWEGYLEYPLDPNLGYRIPVKTKW